MTLSLNDRALERADRLAGDAEALGVAVTTLSNGTRLIDCGAQAPGGFEAGRRFAEICMGGLGAITYAPQDVTGAKMDRAVAFNAWGTPLRFNAPWWFWNLFGEQAVFLLSRRG